MRIRRCCTCVGPLRGLAQTQVAQFATVGGRVASPTAVPKPGLKVSLHPAPQQCAPCHGYPSSDGNHHPGWGPAVSRLSFLGHRSLMHGMGSSAYEALLPPVTRTLPARRQPILGVTPGLCFFGHPPPQQHAVGTYSVNRGLLGGSSVPHLHCSNP